MRHKATLLTPIFFAPFLFLAALLGAPAAAPAAPGESSWMFLPGNFSHDPASGRRVVQFQPLPAIAGLPDSRPLQSGYRRSRVQIRGADGSSDSYYRVESFGNGRGGIDSQWERLDDRWRTSTIGGGNFSPYGWGPWHGGPRAWGGARHPGHGRPPVYP